MFKSVFSLLFYLLILTVSLSGCGYHLVGSGSLPTHIKTLYIPLFINKTQEQGAEDILTRAVINEFITGKVKLVDSSQADARLSGEIVSYTVQPIQFNSNKQVIQYKLTVGVNVKLEDLVNRKVLWEQQNLTEDEDFNVSPDISPIELDDRERQAFERLANDLAGRILDLATEGF